ncbi:MAG: YitT family protein [Erysipelotrichaceae bacterium]|nr:YitT family protein [Erysipelotrichaceae bacterium]
MEITKKDVKTFVMIVISALIYSISLKAFVESGGLIPGGFSGITRLIIEIGKKFFNVSLSFGVIYVCIHILPTIMVYKYVGHRFTIFSIIQYLLVSLFTSILPVFPVTEDLLLIAVFGGILSGTGISIALRQNASSGGTDFIAVYFANKYKIPTWNYIMAMNIGMLTIAGFLFGWNIALYSIIYQFCNTQVVNLRHDRYKLTTLTIITEKGDQVCQTIFKTCRHGITVLNGEGAYSHHDKQVLIMTINTYQVHEVIQAVKKTDPNVFINVAKTEQIVGNYYQTPLG